jgi:hypothetical protein
VSGTLINLVGIDALNITGISSASVSAGVASFTVAGGGTGTESGIFQIDDGSFATNNAEFVFDDQSF